MSERDPAVVIAERLRLPPARDAWNEPWRYWVLRYLAELANLAEFEGQPFTRDEARAALDAMAQDIQDLMLLMRVTSRRRR